MEELGRTKPRIVSELMEVVNRFTDGEDAYNNKRAHSPKVDRASRERRRSRNKEGNKNREYRENNSWEREKPMYSGPSAEDMLHGPCRIHYTYLDGKRVSNHQMKDCRTFLRLQGVLDSNQGTHQGGRNTSQGYQMQRLERHLESEVYISAMIQPVPKSKKSRRVYQDK
jgi:hypothetical protein